MILRTAIACLLLLCAAFGRRSDQEIRRPLRVALVGFGSSCPPGITDALASALEASGRVMIAEPSLVEPASRALGYEGSIDMSTDEARRLGSAIGCDFFVIGKTELLTRSERAKEVHLEALLAIMIVDGRGGILAVFDLLAERAESSDNALAALAKTVAMRAPGYVERIAQFRSSRESIPSSRAIERSESEPIEEMPLDGTPQAVDFKPPEFLNRVKPQYTSEAERADVNAAVEVTVVLRSNGEVGQAEIKRWAGFGLEDSALLAIRQLKFKPATRNGKAVSMRALIRYNFRRIGQ